MNDITTFSNTIVFVINNYKFYEIANYSYIYLDISIDTKVYDSKQSL